MKLIPKMAGGSIAHLLASYSSIEPYLAPKLATTTSKSSKSEDSDKGKLTKKDIFALLKDTKALPNEVKSITSLIMRMYDSVTDMPDGILSNLLAHLYSAAITSIKTAEYNLNLFNKIKELVIDNKGLDEYAVTSTGKLVTYSPKEGLGEISVEEALSDNLKDKTLVTNNNLFYLRSQDPNFVSNNSIFSILSNGIGLEKIQTLIKNSLSNIGEDTVISEGYTSREGNSIRKGLGVLQDAKEEITKQGLTLEGLYKTEVISKLQLLYAQMAIDYAYSMLPQNAKTILQVEASKMKIRSGLTPTKDDAKELIAKLLVSRTSTTQEIRNTFQSDLNLDGSKKSKSSNGDDDFDKLKLNTPSKFLMGIGRKETVVINGGTDYSTVVLATSTPLTNKDGDYLGLTTLSLVFKGEFGGGIFDPNRIMMGGRKIDPINFDLVVITDGQVYSIDYPIDAMGNPDMRPATAELMQKASIALKNAGIDMSNQLSIKDNYEKINEIYLNEGLGPIYDSNGKLLSNWGRFAVMNGIADDRTLDQDPLGAENRLLNEVTDETRIDKIRADIASSAGYVPDFDKKDKWWFFEGSYDRLFEGTIWVAIGRDYQSALMNKEMTADTINTLEDVLTTGSRWSAEQARKNWKNPNEAI